MIVEARCQSRWWIVCPVGLALALHWGVILGRQFDGLYGQDAFAYYDYALQIWESVRHLRLPPPFYWPIGYPALIAAGFSLTGFSSLSGQIVNALAGAGIVVLTYALARDLLVQEGLSAETGRWVGAVASLLAATSGQLWQWSITLMSDTAALCWATLAAWALVRYGGTWRLRWLLLAAFALAWAMMTRWIYALLLLPFSAYWMQAVIGRQQPAVRHLLLGSLVGLAVLAPQIVLSVAFPAPLLSHQWLVSWSPVNALRREFETVDGYATYPLPVALFYANATASPRYLFPLFTPLLFLGLGIVTWRQRWRVATLLLGWGVVTYGCLCGIPYQNFRFTLALLPVLMILTAIGLRQVWEWLMPRWRLLLLAYLLVGLVGGLWYNNQILADFIDRKEAELAVARWVENQMAADSRVLAFGLTLTLQHYTPLDVHELFDLSTEDLQSLLTDGRPTYLLVAVESLQRQWLGHSPERNYRWLRDGPGLVPLGTQAGYTLFRLVR
jgi:4-amino-4-deoxy-L-arabinose transferase-like glycosyltransferase